MPICAGRSNGTERIPFAASSFANSRNAWRGARLALPLANARCLLITLAFSVFHCPRMRGLQGITARMSIEPRLETLLVDRQLHYLRSSAQFAEGFHYLGHGRKNEFVHRLGFSFAGIRVKVHPPCIRTKYKHLCFRHRVVWCNAHLRNKKWSCLNARPKIQNLRVAIIVGNRSHWLILLWVVPSNSAQRCSLE